MDLETILLYFALIMILVLIGIKIFMGILFQRAYNENRANKLLLGVTIFFFLMAISRIGLFYFDFVLTQFQSSLYPQNAIFWKIFSGFQYAGFFCLIFAFEKVIFEKKTKYLISLLYAIFVTIAMAIPDFFEAQFWAGIPLAIAALFIPISYIYLAKTSQGDIRKKSLAIFAGFMLFAVGLLILGEDIVTILMGSFSASDLLIRYFLHIISVGFKLGAIILLRYGYLKK